MTASSWTGVTVAHAAMDAPCSRAIVTALRGDGVARVTIRSVSSGAHRRSRLDAGVSRTSERDTAALHSRATGRVSPLRKEAKTIRLRRAVTLD